MAAEFSASTFIYATVCFAIMSASMPNGRGEWGRSCELGGSGVQDVPDF